MAYGKGGGTATLSESGVIIDNRPYPPWGRRIMKFDNSGNLNIDMFVETAGSVLISEDNTWYSIDGSKRSCPSAINRVWSASFGDLVILHPETAPDRGRNLYRFEVDGKLRWQIGQREFRPADSIIGANRMSNGNVRAVASENGWSAELDDKSGAFIRLLETNMR